MPVGAIKGVSSLGALFSLFTPMDIGVLTENEKRTFFGHLSSRGFNPK